MDILKSVATARNRVEEAFEKKFGNIDGMIVAMAPGRVNLIGEHTDYNDGFVFPMTIDRAVYVGLRARSDAVCSMYSVNFDSDATWSRERIERNGHPPWTAFVKGVQQMLISAGYPLRGVEGVIYGDVPIGSGLSSSAAIEVATAYALQTVFRFDMDPVEMIRLCQRAENEFVGVQCGIMDQFVSRLGTHAHALLLDCRSLQHEQVPFSFEKITLLIVDTKMKRALLQSAYNERRAECDEAVRIFRSLDPRVRALRDVPMTMFEEHHARLFDKVRRRARHVITENQRVHNAVAALKADDIITFGTLMYESHHSLRADYEVSCAELDGIVDTAQKAGALGARLTGAGFGGCALVLSTKEQARKISEAVSESYRNQFGSGPTIMTLTDNFETGTV
jgi:galactokinase